MPRKKKGLQIVNYCEETCVQTRKFKMFSLSPCFGFRSERSGVRNLPPPCCVLEQDTLLPESTG